MNDTSSNPASTSAWEKVSKVLLLWDAEPKPIDQHEVRDDSIIRQALDELKANPQLLDELLANLQFGSLTDSKIVFQFLSQAHHFLGFNENANTLLGLIWARIYDCSTDTLRQSLLTHLTKDQSFFSLLYSLPAFVAHSKIKAETLANWFIEIRTRLGDDMGGSGLWNSLNILAEDLPDTAVEVLEIWISSRPDVNVTTMAVSLLGRLRAKAPTITQAIDETLIKHPDELLRIVYHRSWAFYDHCQSINSTMYERLVRQMTSGTPAEVGEALHFIRCTLAAEHRCDDSFKFGISWLHANAPSDSEATWIHWIIHLAISCDDRAMTLGLQPCRLLISQLLPIPEGHGGTWRELEKLLMRLLKNDREAFTQILFEIAKKDHSGIVRQFSRHEGFHQLPAALLQDNPASIVAKALDSLDEAVRHLGVTLFGSLGLEHLPEDHLSQWSDDWICLLICQVQVEISINGSCCRFLIAMENRVGQGSEQLKDYYVAELVWQMKNLPGACLEPFKNTGAKSAKGPLLRRASQLAEHYFDKLSPCYRSAINSMGVRGYRRAQRLENRRQSRIVSESAEKSSSLFSLVSKSYTLYGGKQWINYMGGNLGEPSEMKEFSHSSEFPRLYSIDPDGCAQKRRSAIRLMSDLAQSEAKRRMAAHDA